jgi:3-oxoacyl-[acyl-carrier-protein] synthase-1
MSSTQQAEFRRQLSVQSVGMVSSVGLDAPSSCAAVRARIARLEEIPFHDRAGQPIIAAPANEAVLHRQGYRRLAPMLARAIGECMTRAGADAGRVPDHVPLLVSIGDAERPDYPPDIAQQLLSTVQEVSGIRFPPSSQVFCGGITGFFRTLALARQLLTEHATDACMVAAADSLLNAPALSWLEDGERLKTEVNSDGVIPGEAAAALWITRPQEDGTSLLDIAGFGFAEEKTVLEEDKPNLAEGLADALRSALDDAGAALHEIDFRVGGMTGERLAFMEASTAVARVQRVHKEAFELWVPAEKLGDVGAALPACMMVVTAIGIAKGYAPGRSAVLYVSSSGTPRAACVVAAPQGRSHGQ